MSYINWNDRYLTHIAKFDEQHQHLFQLINDLYAGVMACSRLEEEKEVTNKVLTELIQYAQDHFAAEEELMRQYAYPDFEVHKAQHDQFWLRLNELIRSHITEAPGLSNEVFIFLRDWITDHVTETDIEYAAFFQEKGVQ